LESRLGGRLTKAGVLLLHRPGALGLQSRVAGILLLERSLAEARRLRSERAGLLLLLLLLRLASGRSKRVAILRLAWPDAVAAEKRVRIRIHGRGNGAR